MSGFSEFAHRKFWRLENAYGDFENHPKTGNILPCDNYIMRAEEKQVFAIDLAKKDGSVERRYYRSDGNKRSGNPITEEFET